METTSWPTKYYHDHLNDSDFIDYVEATASTLKIPAAFGNLVFNRIRRLAGLERSFDGVSGFYSSEDATSPIFMKELCRLARNKLAS